MKRKKHSFWEHVWHHIFVHHIGVISFSFIVFWIVTLDLVKDPTVRGVVAAGLFYVVSKLILPFIKNWEIYSALDEIIRERSIHKGDVAYAILADFIHTNARDRVKDLYDAKEGIEVVETELININRACFASHRHWARRIFNFFGGKSRRSSSGYYALVNEGFKSYLDKFPFFNEQLAGVMSRESSAFRLLAHDKAALQAEFGDSTLQPSITNYIESCATIGLDLWWVPPDEWKKLKEARHLSTDFALWLGRLSMEYHYSGSKISIRIIASDDHEYPKYVSTLRELALFSERVKISGTQLVFEANEDQRRRLVESLHL